MSNKYTTSELIEYIDNIKGLPEFFDSKHICTFKEIKHRLLELDEIKEQERKDKIRWKKLCRNKLY